MPIKDIPAEARPREKLLSRGPGALSDIELLAILLRTGIQGKGVLQMAEELLQLKNDSASRTIDGGFGGFSGLLHATPDDLKRVKGLGPAKRAEIVAVLELARRAGVNGQSDPNDPKLRRRPGKEVIVDYREVSPEGALRLLAKEHGLRLLRSKRTSLLVIAEAERKD